MKKKSPRTKIIFIVFLAALVVGGFVFLGVQEIPAPVRTVEVPVTAQ